MCKKKNDLKTKKENKEKKWLAFFKYLVKIELSTDAGKVNFRAGVGLIVLCLVLTAKNWIMEILNIAAVMSGHGILHEATNAMLMFVLIVVFFILCVLLLVISDNKKNGINDEISKI